MSAPLKEYIPWSLSPRLYNMRLWSCRNNIYGFRCDGNLVLDADGMTAEIDGEEISIATREFNIIYKLLSYPKKTFTRAQLMDEFWGIESDVSLRAVDVYITKLRDKFSACDGFEIKTVRGLDYKAVLL